VSHGFTPSFKPIAKPTLRRNIVEIETSEVVDIVREQIRLMELDLSGTTVIVGAASGYQAALATATALAGANIVIAFARGSKGYPNTLEATVATMALSQSAGVSRRLEIVNHFDSRRWHDVDIVANCPQVAPISRSIVELLPQHAVIALMAEPWEVRPGVVDVGACLDAGIKVVAPNLAHPAIMLFPEFARLCGILLEDAGIDPRDAKLAIVSDTPCASFIERALRERGARTSTFSHPLHLTADTWTAIIVALRPSDKPLMNIQSLGRISESAPNAVLIQFSGELDRSAASYFGLKVWPPKKPGRGQLGLLLDVLGPQPIIRKLIGGLKAAEAAYRGAELGRHAIGFAVEPDIPPSSS